MRRSSFVVKDPAMRYQHRIYGEWMQQKTLRMQQIQQLKRFHPCAVVLHTGYDARAMCTCFKAGVQSVGVGLRAGEVKCFGFAVEE